MPSATTRHCWGLVLALFATSVVWGAPGDTNPVLPTLGINLSIENRNLGKAPTSISGDLTLASRGDLELCFYLPYNDPNYGDSRTLSRRMELLTERLSRIAFKGGGTQVAVDPGESGVQIDLIRPYLLRLRRSSAGPDIKLKFSSQMPLLPNFSESDWYFEGYYPQPLTHCPAADETADYFQVAYASIQGHAKIPDGFEFAGLGDSNTGQVNADFVGRSWTFSLARYYKVLNFVAADVPVTMKYHSDDFAKLRTTIEQALTFQTKLLGPFPYPKLVVVETSELQNQGEPGILSFNRPKQQIFKSLQTDWLNWRQWVITSFVAGQWLGSALSSESPDDDWLVQGLVDFVTFDTLRAYPVRYNLFNTFDDSGTRWFSFNYLQIQELSAATLRRYAPLTRLTTDSLESALPARSQHPLQYIKHAVAMRQMRSEAGETPFAQMIRRFTTEHLHERIKPKQFFDYIGALPSPFSPSKRADLAAQLRQWWTQRGWSDFAVDRFEAQEVAEGRWLAKVNVLQKGDVSVPTSVQITDEGGRNYLVNSAPRGPKGEMSQIAVVTNEKPKKVVIDPNHDVYDVDRFNNKTTWPTIVFFPGNAYTLEDDNYTVLWAPYGFRRPGESVSLGLRAALFRYVQSGLYLTFEGSPADKKSSGEGRYALGFPDLALQTEAVVSEDYDDSRVAQLSIARSPLLALDPEVSLGTKLRHRETAGAPQSRHQTVALTGGLRPVTALRPCSYKVAAETEATPRGISDRFSYSRTFGSLEWACEVGGAFDFGVRLFGGKLSTRGDVPDSVGFKLNDLREARLRLDVRGLERVKELAVVNTDLLLPFALPLPGDTLVLARQLRGRLFFDGGKAYDRDTYYRSAGAGILVPFGGDIMGAGALAFSRLTVLGIFYTNIGGVIARKPSVVFDLTGEL